MKEIEIGSNSGPLSATLFEGSKKDIVLIINSATGVKQSYYQKFAQFVASQEITVITYDYTGIGRSLNRPIREVENNVADWGRNDIESVIQYVANTFPASRKVMLGHSVGGQLIGLAKSSNAVDKILLVASQSGYWKHWKGGGKFRMWFNWYILFPVMLRVFGYLNSKKISGMENLPKEVANQWRNWGKHPDYLLSDKSLTNLYYEKIDAEMTAFSIEDDEFAPQEAVHWMTSQYKNAEKQSVHLKPRDFGVSNIGHFGVFREKFRETIWQQFLKEITKTK